VSRTRARIERHVERNPGVHFRELTRALDLATGQVQYHLGRLDGITGEPIGGRTHYYPARTDEWDRRALAYLRRETARDVVVALLDRGETRPDALAEDVGIARSTLEHHLDGLIENAVVEKRRAGNRVTLTLARPDETARLLRAVEPSPPARLTDRFERLVDSLLDAE
jgi:predicted transcriptional regulator